MSDTEQIPTIPKKRVYKKRQPVVIARSDVSNEPTGSSSSHLATVPDPEPVLATVPEPVPPKKRERSEKQILAFKKMQEKRKEQDELKKLNKTIEKDKQIHDTHSTKIQKLKDKIISNASLIISDDEEPVQPMSRSDIVPMEKPTYKEDVSSRPKPVSRKPRPKKTIPRGDAPRRSVAKAVLDDDDDEQEEQVHITPRALPRQVSNDVKYIFV